MTRLQPPYSPCPSIKRHTVCSESRVGPGPKAHLTVVAARPPGPDGAVQDAVQPQQEPADAEAQQKAQHQVHLLLGHTVTDKVVL